MLNYILVLIVTTNFGATDLRVNTYQSMDTCTSAGIKTLAETAPIHLGPGLVIRVTRAECYATAMASQ